MRDFTVILAVSLVAPLSTLPAQQPPIEPGARVRVTQECVEGYTSTSIGLTTVCPEHVGMLYTFASDSIVLETGESGAHTRIPLASVTRFELSRGKSRHAGRGALIGLGIGAGGGAIIGAIAEVSGERYCIDTCAAAGVLTAFTAIGLAIPGVVIGTVAGALIKTDRWEEVPLDRVRVSLAPTRDGVSLGMRIAF